ncbi:protein IQ-DOMAIN 1-like [Cucurbita pepo subsp. pepo]|uniref:protein IQ-DOMAIN 1-like n=1 Tax=Cucurbita pepo subsp. pepo TaxID=3664 RepID=UPI000C9D806F|nr:protein IQ-DOMAIN 1-like [Cucurbita pepo subsp. pepo]XP_023513234.1 protein IQ-DOMAIN 1-like [Cucurbita pepo subsp. pepo]
MGKKGGWFSAVKKAFAPESKDKKDQKANKTKKRWFGKPKKLETVASGEPAPLEVSILPIEEVKLANAENEQSKHAYSVAIATAVAAEVAVAAAQAAAEVVRLTTRPWYSGKSKEEIAAIKIQTAFRGYMARRALRALRGLVRLKSLIQGQSVKRQATSTLRCMQTLARVQSQIRARRLRLSEENQALQRQLQQKHERELERLTVSANNEWDDSTKSKEQVEARLVNRQEAATRRERALAYAYSHQKLWNNSSKSENPTFMDPNNPHWGWSWLERWMAARPWETKSTVDYHDRGSVKSAISHATSIGDIAKSYARRDFNLDIKPFPRTPTSHNTSRAPSRQSPATPTKAQSSLSAGRKLKPASPRGLGWGGDDDSRSGLSVKSERFRRRSIAGSSVRDDESFTSSPSVPSYMASTEAARARSRLSSPMGIEKTTATPEKEAVSGGAKKRLSFTASTATVRRHSGPPKIDATPIKNVAATERDFTGESR